MIALPQAVCNIPADVATIGRDMKRKAELPETEPVHLRPICGIRPGIAILAGLAAIAIAASFLLLILPGLLASGGYVSFALDSDSAAVYMDGVYIGSGKGSVYYLPEGEHEFAFSIYGADAGSVTAEVEKKVFGSLFVHRVKEIPHEIVLTPEIEDAVITRFASSIAEWSRVLDFSDRYPYPPLFQDLASDAIALGFDDISDAMLYGALHVTSEAVYGDFRAAMDMLEGSAVSYRSTELDMMEDLLRRIWTEGMAGDGCTAAAGSLPAGTAAGGFISYDGTGMDIGNTDAVTFPEVKEHAKHVTVPAFSIAEDMVSEYGYALFVAENPYWAKGNAAQLAEDGMADVNYLAGIRLSTNVASDAPIRNISRHAADAYAAWLSEKEGITCRLPTEYEWMLSCEGGSMMWELTSSPFIPYGRLVPDSTLSRLAALFPYDDAIVKGRDRETVGALDPAQCSEYAGFRIVKDGN